MDTIKTNNLTEESLWEIEDTLMGVECGGKGSGGEKSGKRGKKTLKAIAENNKESAEKKRKEEAEENLKRELQHFPFRNFSEEKTPELIEDFSNWVLKSLEEKYPCFTNLDNEIVYTQSRSSGPGGQNVNKTSTAVTAKHLLTGIFSRSEDSREVVINKRTALSKLLERLENHVKSWGVYLKGIPEEKRQDEIKSFMKNLVEEKLG